MVRIRGGIAALLSLALAGPTGALTIDDFDQGIISVFDDTNSAGATTQENGGLDPASAIGGVRFVTATAESALATYGTAQVTSTGGSATVTALQQGTYSFFYDGVADGAANTTDGDLFLDLTGRDRFALTFVNTTAPEAEFRVTLWDGDSGSNAVYRSATTGVNEVLFTEFSGIDFGDVRTIRVQIAEVLNAGSLVVTDFSAVPEPGTAVLLGLGLLGLATRARSRR